MAVDIVPGLLETIEKAFRAAIEADRRYTRIANRVRDGTATIEDIHSLSVIYGEALSGALLENFTPEYMPGGVYYWNIVERVLGSTLRQNYELVNRAASEIQNMVDEAAGIGLNAVAAPWPEERAKGLYEKIVGDTVNPTRWLGEPVINITESFSDDYMMENAAVSARAGLEPKIIRKLGAFEVRRSKKRSYEIPCDWCQSLAGEYNYDGSQPKDIFQRHESCRCAVFYSRGKLRQDVYSKRWYSDTGQGVLNIKDYEPFRRTASEAAELNEALEAESARAAKRRRERLIEQYARENNVSHRRAANRLTRAGNS